MADQTRARSLTATRTLGALALLVVGGVHYQQYLYAFYSSIPTIGPLFLANFIAATALGLFLLAPVRSRLGRLGELLDQSVALAGVAVAAGALAAADQRADAPVRFQGTGLQVRDRARNRIRGHGDRDAHAVPGQCALRGAPAIWRTASGEPINQRPVAQAAET